MITSPLKASPNGTSATCAAVLADLIDDLHQSDLPSLAGVENVLRGMLEVSKILPRDDGIANSTIRSLCREKSFSHRAIAVSTLAMRIAYENPVDEVISGFIITDIAASMIVVGEMFATIEKSVPST